MMHSELLNLYLFAQAIAKAALMTGLGPGIAAVVVIEKFGLPYFCKISGQPEETPCHHASCQSDPSYRVDDDTLIALATTCSNRELALHAEVTLRKRYPSRKVRHA